MVFLIHIFEETVMDSDFKGRHFQGEIILWAVRWYCIYRISYRELAEIFEERGDIHYRPPKDHFDIMKK